MTIGSLINDVSTLFGVPTGEFLAQLQPASWKGVPFAVIASRARFGRRNAIHEYPYRDTPWVEDLGLGRQRIHLKGFLVGDDVIAQSNRMIAACKSKNESDEGGKLVHPIFGENLFVLLDFEIGHPIEGRVAELEFDFITSSKRQFPAAGASTSDQTAQAADDADGAASESYAAQVIGALKNGAIVVRGVVGTVQKYGGLVFRLVNDATSLIKTVQALPGEFGRFFAGASATLYGPQRAMSAGRPTTVQQLTAQGAQNRANVTSAMATAQAGAASLTAGSAHDFAGQTQAVMSALAAATLDPADQVRAFTEIAAFAPSIIAGSLASPAQQPTIDLWRRAALTALARSSAAYQPSSYDDAARLRGMIVGLLDAEIGIAGDQGEDDVFLAFRGLKTAVAADLTARGATLSPIVTISFSASLPAPVIAMKQYQNAGRTEELVGEANVRHPAFMPTSFRALAS